MTWQAWVYLGLFIAWAITESIALIQKDTPQKPRTLSAVLRWLVQPVAGWHMHLRYGFMIFIAWFSPHILGH